MSKLTVPHHSYIQVFVFSGFLETVSVKIVDGMLQSIIAEMDLLDCLPSRFRFHPDFRFPQLSFQWRTILGFAGVFKR